MLSHLKKLWTGKKKKKCGHVTICDTIFFLQYIQADGDCANCRQVVTIWDKYFSLSEKFRSYLQNKLEIKGSFDCGNHLSSSGDHCSWGKLLCERHQRARVASLPCHHFRRQQPFIMCTLNNPSDNQMLFAEKIRNKSQPFNHNVNNPY